MFKIIVLIKQVPDIKKVKFDRERGVIDRKSAPNEINPFDLNALETAIRIKENNNIKDEVKICALSMGPESAEKSLREAVARGADEAVLLTDKTFAASDTWATSLVLSKAIEILGDYNLIIAGEKTVDGDTGQVGPEIAELLDIPQACYVNEIKDISTDDIEIINEIFQGAYKKTLSFPCLLTVTKDINDPRLPSIKDKMKARKIDIKKLNYDSFKDFYKEDELGLKGSPTKIKNIEVAAAVTREGKQWKDNFEEAIEEINNALIDNKIIGAGSYGK